MSRRETRQTNRDLCLPNQERTLNKLSTELRCRNFVAEHRLSMQVGAQTCKNVACDVYVFQLSFRFACHRWWLGKNCIAHSFHALVVVSAQLPVVQAGEEVDELRPLKADQSEPVLPGEGKRTIQQNFGLLGSPGFGPTSTFLSSQTRLARRRELGKNIQTLSIILQDQN